MKSIRIKVDVPNIPAELNIKHVATSYRISKDPNMQDETKVIFEVNEDNINLYEIIVDANISEHETVYVSTRYHYIDANFVNYPSKWSLPAPINPNRHGITYPDTILYTPKVEYRRDEDGVITIHTNPMSIFTGIGDHEATSYVFENSDGYPVYVRKDDIDNKESILPNIEFEKAKAYVIKASHVSTGNNESNYGKDIFINGVIETGLYEFEVFTPFYVNTNVWHRLKIYVPNFKNYDLEIRRPNGEVIKTLYNCNILVHYINTFGFEYNNLYEWWVRVRFTDDSVTDYKKEFEGIALKKGEGDEWEDEDIAFIGKISDGPTFDVTGDTNYNTSINSFELNSKEFMYIVDNKITLLKVENNSIKKVKDLLDLKTLNSTNSKDDKHELIIPYASFIKHKDFTVLIHYRVQNNNDHFGGSVFLYSNYNPITKELEIIDTKYVREDENRYGIANSIVRISNNLYYGVYETDPTLQPIREGIWLLRIEVTEEEINLKTYIAKKKGRYSFARLITNKNKDVFLVGGSQNVGEYSKVYTTNSELRYVRDNNDLLRIDLDRIQEDKNGITDILPDDFDVTTPLISIPSDMSPYEVYDYAPVSLANGEVLFFNNCDSGAYKESQNLIVYNSVSGLFRYEEYDLKLKVPFRNIVRFNNWDILRISSNVESKQKTYWYLSAQNDPDKVTESTAELSYPKKLSFKDKITNISVPYHFENGDRTEDYEVGIQPPYGKQLKWVDKKNYRTYTFANPIFSRSITEPVINEGIPIEFCRGITTLNNVTLHAGLGQIVGENTYQVGHGANPAPYQPYLKLLNNNISIKGTGSVKVTTDHNQAELEVEYIGTATQHVTVTVPDPEVDNKTFTVKGKGVAGSFSLKVKALGVDGEEYVNLTLTGTTTR